MRKFENALAAIARVIDPACSFRFTPAENESVDSEFEMFDGSLPLRRPTVEDGAAMEGYAIQVCGRGYFAANAYLYDGMGNLTALIDLGTTRDPITAAYKIAKRAAA
jgi:hypothetical protein